MAFRAHDKAGWGLGKVKIERLARTQVFNAVELIAGDVRMER
jgi:hypothetical protein